MRRSLHLVQKCCRKRLYCGKEWVEHMLERVQLESVDKNSYGATWVRTASPLRRYRRAAQRNLPNAPAIDLLFIRGVLLRSDRTEDSREIVGDHHRRVLEAHLYGEPKLIENLEQDCLSRLAALDGVVARHQRELNGVELFQRERQDAVPWSNADRLKVGVYGTLSLATLVAAWFTLQTILLNSGAFEDRWQAASFSLIPLCLPFIGESLYLQAIGEVARRRFVRVLAWISAAFAVAWAALFVLTFGSGLVTSTESVIEAAIDGTGSHDNPAIGLGLLFATILTEAFIASLSVAMIDEITAIHRNSRATPNPERLMREKELSALLGQRCQVAEVLAALQARKRALNALEDTYVARAVSAYDSHLAARNQLLHLWQMPETPDASKSIRNIEHRPANGQFVNLIKNGD